jgi:hypothetical protein
VKLFVGDLGQEELRELRTIRAGLFRRIRQLLDDRAELPGEIVVQMLDQRTLVHVMLLHASSDARPVGGKAR